MNSEKKQVFSKPFNLVLEKDYPSLYLGPGIYKDYKIANKSNPTNWIKKDINTFKKLRRKEAFTFKRFNKNEPNKNEKYINDLQWLSQGIKTTELEVNYENKKKIVKDKDSGINNLSYNLDKLRITQNIKVPRIIDKTINDTDLKSKEGILKIYNKMENVYKIQQLLSIGLLGVKKNRIFVPTRWSITACDDIISRDKIEIIKDYNQINSYELYTYNSYKNTFYIIYIPNNWGFENIEYHRYNYMQDYEINNPRTKYANSVTGGYYATRLEVANNLNSRKKQARVIVLRNIDNSYSSQGVWVIRECIKEALKLKPITFNNLNLLISYLIKKTKPEIANMIKKSKLINEEKYQRKISSYFK